MNEKTVGMLAKFTGVSVHTIKYYEKIGLLSSTRREHSNYRSYDIRACTDIYECMNIINKNVVTLPVHIGDVVIADVFGSNIVVTENKA